MKPYLTPEMLELLKKHMYLSPETAELCFNPLGAYAISRRIPIDIKLVHYAIGKVYAKAKEQGKRL